MLDRAERGGSGDPARADWAVGAGDAVPAAGAAGEDGDDARRGERGPAHPGHRVRLARAGVRRLRLPLRPPRRPLRGGARRAAPAPARRAGDARGALVRGGGCADPASRAARRWPADPHRRQAATHAAPRRRARRPVERRLVRAPGDRRRAR